MRSGAGVLASCLALVDINLSEFSRFSDLDGPINLLAIAFPTMIGSKTPFEGTILNHCIITFIHVTSKMDL